MIRRAFLCGVCAMIMGCGLFVLGGQRMSLADAHNGVFSVAMITGAGVFVLGLIVMIAAFSTSLIAGMAGITKDDKHDD